MPTNLLASMLMLELVEWDQFRSLVQQAGNDEFDASFIEDGALCYQRSLAVLHGAFFTSTPRESNRWLKFSQKSRKKLAKQFPGVIEGAKQVPLTDEHRAHINLQHPELSYTGSNEHLDSTDFDIEPISDELDLEFEADNDDKFEAVDEDIDIGEVTLADLERKYGKAD